MARRATGLASSIFSRLFNIQAKNSRSSITTEWNSCHLNSKTLVPNLGCPVNFQRQLCNSSCDQFMSSSLCFRSKQLSSQPRSLLVGLCSSHCFSSAERHFTGQFEQRRFYQSALRPRLICPGCYFVWRHGRKHVECSDHPRHKQMKRVATRKMWKEDYTAGKWLKAMDFHKVHYRQDQRNVDRTAMSHNWVAGKLGTEL